jgi:hypothetical protein
MGMRAIRLALLVAVGGVFSFGAPIDVGYFDFRETNPLDGFNAFDVYERTGVLGVVNSGISITALRIEVILNGGPAVVLFPGSGVVPSPNGVLLSNEINAGSPASSMALTRAELFYTIAGPATWNLDGGGTFTPAPGAIYSAVLFNGGSDLLAASKPIANLRVGEYDTPEPATAWLAIGGIVCFLAYRKRQSI